MIPGVGGCALTAAQSTWSSFPWRFMTRPAIITVSTFPVSIPDATAVAGSFSGVTFIRSVLKRMTSACFPGVSDPVFASRPFAFAPSIVAQASTSEGVIGDFPCVAAIARWSASTERI